MRIVGGDDVLQRFEHQVLGEYTQDKDRRMAFFTGYKTTMPRPDEALKGREAGTPVADRHAVNGTPLVGPFPAGLEQARQRRYR